MRVTWYGTAPLTVETDAAVIAFDPFDGIAKGVRSPGTGELQHAGEYRRGSLRKPSRSTITTTVSRPCRRR